MFGQVDTVCEGNTLWLAVKEKNKDESEELQVSMLVEYRGNPRRWAKETGGSYTMEGWETQEVARGTWGTQSL